MLNLPVNPLDNVIDSVVAAGRYFTKQHYEKLKPLMDKHGPPPVAPEVLKQAEAFAKDSDSLDSVSVEGMLSKQVRTFNRLQSMAAASDNIKELKDVMAASQNLITQISKLKDIVAAEEALAVLEDAITEALNELAEPEIKAKFFKLLKSKTARRKEKSK